MSNSGLRAIEGVNVLPLDGLWGSIAHVPAEDKMGHALEYAGCEFLDDQRKLVAGNVAALVGLGGIPVAYAVEDDSTISERIDRFVAGSREMMGSAAAFSYLNSGEKTIPELYETVAGLGHFSVAHTIQANFVLAGISEAAELEINLQRDLVHISKVTNARSIIQNAPPVVVRNPANAEEISKLYKHIVQVAEKLRLNNDGDMLEDINGLFPVNKATILMLSGDLSNFRKLCQLRNDKGKEHEVREVVSSVYDQLNLLWPEIFNERGERS